MMLFATALDAQQQKGVSYQETGSSYRPKRAMTTPRLAFLAWVFFSTLGASCAEPMQKASVDLPDTGSAKRNLYVDEAYGASVQVLYEGVLEEKSLVSEEELPKSLESDPQIALEDEVSSSLGERCFQLVTGFSQGNPERDSLSEKVVASQKAYAEKQGYDSVVYRENLAKQCKTLSGLTEECQPHWSKIAILRKMLQEPPVECTGESWIVWLDDDMPITNTEYRLETIFERLELSLETSFIVTQDPQKWAYFQKSSINTGVIFVRRDAEGSKVVEEIWKRRNDPTRLTTLGTCRNQSCLHEQEALSRLLEVNGEQFPFNETIRIIDPREAGVGINTLSREDEYVDLSRRGIYLNYQADNKERRWREGDFCGQCSGVPLFGYQGSKLSAQTGQSLRLKCINKMLASAESLNQPLFSLSKILGWLGF